MDRIAEARDKLRRVGTGETEVDWNDYIADLAFLLAEVDRLQGEKPANPWRKVSDALPPVGVTVWGRYQDGETREVYYDGVEYGEHKWSDCQGQWGCNPPVWWAESVGAPEFVEVKNA
jgi:hypothetical protein